MVKAEIEIAEKEIPALQHGLLKIEVNPFKSGVKILISDNGMGRKAASQFKDSSGNGIKIMNDLFALFQKYYGYAIKINFQIIFSQNIKKAPRYN